VALSAPTFSLVTADAVREILDADLAAARDVVAGVYLRAAGGGVVNPPSLFLRPDPGRPERWIALPAAVEAPRRAVGVKWIGSFPGNVDGGLPRASAVIVLNDPDTGFPVACLEGAVISATRTALSAVVGAEALLGPPPVAGGAGGAGDLDAVRDLGRLAVIGAGVIARRTVAAFLALGWRTGAVSVFDVRAEAAAGLAAEVSAAAGVEARAAGSPSGALAGADVVLIATTATTPWLADPALTRPGVTVLHLSLRDVTPGTMAGCDHVVDDPAHAAREGTSLEIAIRQQGLDAAAVRPIGALLSGAAKRDRGRPVIYSPFGLGALDVALADLVLRRAREHGLVVDVPGFFGSAP
jgi:2,3-diaminopropionate biosynthesis protein SbnB